MACPDENRLGMLIDGELDGSERAAIEHHLDDCAACSRVVAELALATPVREVPPRYRLIRRLGAGAMGVVWEADDSAQGQRVALKFLRPDHIVDTEYRGRLLREAQALAHLRHPNILTVYDVGRCGDAADAEMFLALELVDGVDARTWRRSAPRTLADVLRIWGQVAAALHTVHAAGIIHRDLKPENVLVTADDRAVLADFGLATGIAGAGVTTLTSSGKVIGTPLYMPLEQLRGGAATARSDQFALCTCIWEALAGTRPFTVRGTEAARALAMLEQPAIPDGVERALFEVLARGLDPDPAKRWSDVAALATALARWRSLER